MEQYLSGRSNPDPDQTIEILMTELDPKIMKIFTKAQSASSREATKVCLNQGIQPFIAVPLETNAVRIWKASLINTWI